MKSRLRRATSDGSTCPTTHLLKCVSKQDVDKTVRALCDQRKDNPYILDEVHPIYRKGGVSIHRVRDIGKSPKLAVREKDTTSVHITTPIGVRRLVAKVFDKVDRLQRWVIVDTQRNALLKVLSMPGVTRGEAEEVRRRYVQRLKPEDPKSIAAWSVSSFTDSRIVLGDEFVNESCISMLASHYSQWCPHILGFEDAFIHGPTSRGVIIMHRADETLRQWRTTMESERVPVKQMVRMLYGIIFQVASTLHFLQTRMHVKHHDLHESNVFIRYVQPGDEFNGQNLYTVDGFVYRLGGSEFYLPNSRIHPFVGDFGFASAGPPCRRIGRLDISAFNNKPHWGPWTIDLAGAEGYDLQVLLASIESWSFYGTPIAPYIRPLTRIMSPYTMTKRFRPHPGHVSRVTPLRFIQKAFLGPDAAAINFATPPTMKRPVMTLMMDEKAA